MFTTPVKDKRFLSLLTNKNIGRAWSIQETKDTPKVHSRGVKQIISQVAFS